MKVKSSPLVMLETHVEKIVLGVCVLFVAYLAWGYLFSTPNKVNFNNNEVTPGELNSVVLRDAQSMQQSVASGRPEEPPKLNFSQQLVKAQRGGLFESVPKGAPPLPAQLPRVAPFGQRIEVPGLVMEEEAAANVELVTPLPPTAPRLRTGRSLASPNPVVLSVEPPAERATAAPAAEPTEQAWVSIAAYFDEAAQHKEMVKANYAVHRSKVYIVGTEVQRQERRADGTFSEWQDVKAGAAMPTVKIPEPLFDDKSGALVNKQELDAMFQLVRSQQRTLAQPDFMTVAEGDQWDMPPLEGHEDEEEVAEPNVLKTSKPKPEPKPEPRAPVEGGTRTPGGGGAIDVPGEGPIRGPAPSGPSAKDRTEGRQRAKKDYMEARALYRKRDYSGSEGAIGRVLSNEFASKKLMNDASKLKARIERDRQRAPQSGDPPVRPRAGEGDLEISGGGRIRGGGGAAPVEQVATLVMHPERKTPAVWFHDDSVESGKTYRYRMRVKLWNRYVGRVKALKDPTAARKAVIVGEWSPPSEEITVTPSTYFFASGGRTPGRTSVPVEVWKWLNGEWLRQRFEVDVGETIGKTARTRLNQFDEANREITQDVDFATGAVVLDIREETIKRRFQGKIGHSDVPSVVLTYLDPADGQVKERFHALDVADPIRKRLQEESEF